MKIDDYQLLVHLCENQTIRATAKKVLISQPAITQRLKYIEEYFDVLIFLRTPKKLVVTAAGELIIEHAKQLLKEERAVHDQVAHSKGVVSGKLSLGVSSLVSQHYLPELLEAYTAIYPAVSIDLITGVSEEIRQAASDFHVCIVRGEPVKDHHYSQMFSDPLYLCDTKPIGGTETRPFIEFKTDSEFLKLIEGWLLNQKGLSIKRSIKVDQFETAKQLMKRGLGMTVLPQSILDPECRELPHLALEDHNHQLTRDTWLCYQPRIRSLPQVDTFVRFAEDKSWI